MTTTTNDNEVFAPISWGPTSWELAPTSGHATAVPVIDELLETPWGVRLKDEDDIEPDDAEDEFEDEDLDEEDLDEDEDFDELDEEEEFEDDEDEDDDDDDDDDDDFEYEYDDDDDF